MTDGTTNFDGKILKIFLKNGYHFKGAFIRKDSEFLTIFDYKLQGEKLLAIGEIREIEVVEE